MTQERMNIMNGLKYILSILCVAGLITSCTQDDLDSAMPTESIPLTLTANLYEAVATPASASTRSTLDGEWDADAKVAVRVNKNLVKKYTATPNTTAGSATLACPELTGEDTDFLWSGNDETKAVDAWYPYSETAPTGWTISLVQTPETMAAEDLMYAKSKNFTLANQATQALEFKHQLGKVIINLKSSSYLTEAKEVKVSLTGQYKTGTFLGGSIGETSLDGDGTWDHTIIPYKLPSAGDGNYASYQALVIQLDAWPTRSAYIQIEVDGTVYGHCLFNNWLIAFPAGYESIYNITVKKGELEVDADVSIKEWETGASGTGEIIF